MATTFSLDLLRGACMAHKLSADGTHDELVAGLGAHLVAQLLNPDAAAPYAAAAAHVNKKEKKKKRSPASAYKRPMSAWHHFLRTEKELVKKTGGFHGRVDILREVARRWRLAKRVGTSAQPLMLQPPSSDEGASSDADSIAEGLLGAIRKVPVHEIASSLKANGLKVEDDVEANAMTLAKSMM